MTIDLVAGGYRRTPDTIVENVGITVNLTRAYNDYTAALDNSCEFYEARYAYLWWNCSWWRGLWRHGVYRLLFPHKYEERRALADKGLQMQRQAVLNATLEAGTMAVSEWPSSS